MTNEQDRPRNREQDEKHPQHQRQERRQERRQEQPKPRRTGERAIVLHPRTAAARLHDRSRSTTSHVRGHTIGQDEVMAIVAQERRSAMRAAAVVLIPIFLLPVVFLFLRSVSAEPPPLVTWLVLGPVTLSALMLVGVVHDRRVTARERQRSLDYADPAR